MQEITVLTSLMAKRLYRQRVCVNSWQSVGDVFSLGVPEVNRQVIEYFPDVGFFERAPGYRPHLAKIKSFFDVFEGQDRWVLMTNSDIEWRGKAENLQKCMVPGTLTYFRRRDYEAGAEDYASFFPWGIDVFLFNPIDWTDLPDLPFSLGMPFWDYWIPVEAMRRGLKLQTLRDSPIWHEAHGDRWDMTDLFVMAKIFFDYYGPPMPPWKFLSEGSELNIKIENATVKL